MSIAFRGQAAAAALGLTIDTLRRSADDAGLQVERKQNGASSTRVFRPADLFAIARWRATHHGPVPARRAVAAVWNPKGGIGKTTLAGNLAVAFALQGLRVLVVDLDFQGSLTLGFGYDSELTLEEARAQGRSENDVIQYHLGHLLPGADERQPLARVIKKPWGELGPHLVPADLMLDIVDYRLLVETLSGAQSDLALTKWIAEGRSGKAAGCDLSIYDVILFDCPPSKNRLTRAALLASDAVVSPVNFEHYSTKALSYLAIVLNEMVEHYGRCPELMILGNEHDPQRVRSSMHVAAIAAQYGDALLAQTVRRSEDFPRALDSDPKAPLLLARPTSAAADDVRAVAKLISARMGLFAAKGSARSQEAQHAA